MLNRVHDDVDDDNDEMRTLICVRLRTNVRIRSRKAERLLVSWKIVS